MAVLSWFILIIMALFVLYYLLISLDSSIRYIKVEFPYIFGNTGGHQLALQLADFYKKYEEPIIGIRLFLMRPALIISDLKLVELVLVKKFSYFQNRGLFYNEKTDPLSAILGTVEHQEWKLLRKKLATAFKSAKMKAIFPQLKSLCDVLVENFNEIMDGNGERIVDIVDAFSRFTVDAIGSIAFGNSNEESAERLREMVVKARNPYLTFPFNRFAVAFPGLARSLGVRKHSKEVSDFFVNYVSDIVKYRRENEMRANDFMQSFIDADMEIPRIAAIAFDFLSAGYADSTSTLAYCLYELALNRHIQDLARDEIERVLENKIFTYDVLQKMPYIDQIIKETERKYPVAGIATRVATKPFKVPNTDIIIPRGMKIFIPIYGIHHDEKYYPDPEVFDPDRFTEQARNERLRYSFLPFGDGPRQCIGYKFAEMLIGIGLVCLLKNFEFSICDETQIPIEFNQNKNTLHPKCGVTLKIRRI